jgi:hypothetical protein
MAADLKAFLQAAPDLDALDIERPGLRLVRPVPPAWHL